MLFLHQLFVLVVSGLALLLTSAAAKMDPMTCSPMTETSTGSIFPAKLSDKNLEVIGVGVRRKGPIKVYSVGLYASEKLKQRLSTLSRTKDKATALASLRSAATEEDVSFLLKMNWKVGAEKMASAIADAVSPRHTGKPSQVEELKGLIFTGVAGKGGATPGTTFQFDCSKKGVDVSVDGKSQGGVSSSELSKAFCDIYLDDKSVSASLKDNCIDNWSMP
mmetsp:Transcript_6826/g.9936  ORF Transcript_6826/g.9936 Transcript_6826/m.9936 type:complete len:220 (-) Transcript_6826:127-786(-)